MVTEMKLTSVELNYLSHIVRQMNSDTQSGSLELVTGDEIEVAQKGVALGKLNCDRGYWTFTPYANRCTPRRKK